MTQNETFETVGDGDGSSCQAKVSCVLLFQHTCIWIETSWVALHYLIFASLCYPGWGPRDLVKGGTLRAVPDGAFVSFRRSFRRLQIHGLVQEIRHSSALAMALRLSCINPSRWSFCRLQLSHTDHHRGFCSDHATICHKPHRLTLVRLSKFWSI